MKRHWLVKTLLVIILMLFLAAVLGIGFLHTSPGRKRVYSWLQDYLLANQGIRLETEELRYNLFDLAVTLHQTQLWSRRSPDLPPILTADRMYIDLSLMSLLLDGFLAIEDARIDSPEIRVVVLKDGRSNLPVSEKDVEEEAGGLPDFLIESFRLERGSFTFTDHQSGLRAHLGSWNTAINGDKTSLSHDLTLSAGEGQLAQGAREVPLKRLSLRARIPSNLDRVTIEDLEIESPAAVLEVSGTVDELENPRLAVRITADAVLASISDLMDLRPPLSGRVHWDGEARNGLKDLQVTGKVTGENISYESLEQVNLSSRVLWDMARGRLILSGLSVSSPGTTLAGEADLSTQASGRNSASLEISRLDLEQLMRGLNLDVRFASQATGRVQAAWVSGDLDAGNLQVDLEFSRRAPEASPDVLPLSGSIRLRKEGEEARVQVERIETIGAGIEADIRVSSLSNLQERPDGRLSGRIDAQATDLLRLTTGLARFLGETSPLLGTEVAGSARVQAQVGGTLRQPAVTAEMSADSVRVGGLEGVSLNTAANYRQDRLTIEQGIIGWAREQIRFDGTVSNLRSGNPALDVNARLEEGTIENFFLALGRPSPVQGRLRLLASAQGTVANPQLRADIRASELHAYGEALGTLEGEATLQNRFLVSRLMLQKPSSPSRLDLQASYRFDDQSYELEADAPRFEITSLEAGDRVLTGVFSLRAAGKGALPDPKGALQLDAHSLRYGDDVLGDLQARAEVQNREAVVTATAPRFNFKLDGRVGVEAPIPRNSPHDSRAPICRCFR